MKEVERLKAALKPFAVLIGGGNEMVWTEDKDHWAAYNHTWGKHVTVGMIRAASSALKSGGE